jgi:hypothetical protein
MTFHREQTDSRDPNHGNTLEEARLIGGPRDGEVVVIQHRETSLYGDTYMRTHRDPETNQARFQHLSVWGKM